MSLQRKLGINEYYCPLIDYPNYAVSNYGNVKNRNTGRILKPGKSSNGYLAVNLGAGNSQLIHKLVINAFEANHENKRCIDHKDKWEAYIMINYKKIHLGSFENIEDAKKARQEKSKELFGDYLNSCEK